MRLALWTEILSPANRGKRTKINYNLFVPQYIVVVKQNILYIAVVLFSFLSNGFCLNARRTRLIVQPKIIAFEIRFERAQPSGPENRAPNGVINVPNQAP